MTHVLCVSVRACIKWTFLNRSSSAGGVDSKENKASIRENADIVTATPGKLSELLESGKLNLTNVRLLVRFGQLRQS